MRLSFEGGRFRLVGVLAKPFTGLPMLAAEGDWQFWRVGS